MKFHKDILFGRKLKFAFCCFSHKNSFYLKTFNFRAIIVVFFLRLFAASFSFDLLGKPRRRHPPRGTKRGRPRGIRRGGGNGNNANRSGTPGATTSGGKYICF